MMTAVYPDEAQANKKGRPNSRPAFRTDLAILEHDPEKWKPVFRKDHAQTKR
jgi:hypothetical protein